MNNNRAQQSLQQHLPPRTTPVLPHSPYSPAVEATTTTTAPTSKGFVCQLPEGGPHVPQLNSQSLQVLPFRLLRAELRFLLLDIFHEVPEFPAECGL